MRDLAAMMEARVRLLSPQGAANPIGETHLLVLTGLMLADELTEAKAATAAPAASAPNDELLVAAVDHLTERVDVIAARLDRP